MAFWLVWGRSSETYSSLEKMLQISEHKQAITEFLGRSQFTRALGLRHVQWAFQVTTIYRGKLFHEGSAKGSSSLCGSVALQKVERPARCSTTFGFFLSLGSCQISERKKTQMLADCQNYFVHDSQQSFQNSALFFHVPHTPKYGLVISGDCKTYLTYPHVLYSNYICTSQGIGLES